MAGNVVPSADDNFDASIAPQTEETGGKIKASGILGSISGIASAASAIPVLAPFSAPLSAITGLAGLISKAFGGGIDVQGSGFTQKELEMLGHIKMRHDARVAAAR